MKKLIITGHGHYASGLKSSLELLAGANEDLIFIDFLGEMSEADLKQQMEEILERYHSEEFLIVCDIVGGTPYKNAAILANETDRIEVVAGCNLGSILEAVFQMEAMPLADLAANMVDSSKQYTVRFEKIKEVQTANTDDASFEDGI